MTEPRIAVIIGSVRARRICPQVAAWVAGIGRDVAPLDLQLVDLRDWPLPMDEEPGIPSLAAYALEHTRRWSERIAASDGFVFVTPQYNWGYPAALKNAIDHLYAEWREKPAMIVTYGGHGGGKCAEQLRQVLGGALKMPIMETMPALSIAREHIEADAGTIDPAAVFAAEVDTIRRAFAELAAAFATRGSPR